MQEYSSDSSDILFFVLIFIFVLKKMFRNILDNSENFV